MSTNPVNILLPTGRLVWGDPYRPREKDADGKPLTIKTGPDAGKPRVDYGLGVAIAKQGERAWWETPWGLQIYQVAQASNPGAVASAVGELQAGREAGKFFAFKIVDGDSTIPNERNRKPCDREGYPGHWILSLSSSFAPRIFNSDGTQPILDPGAVKTGYYVQAYINVRGNDSAQSPGIYLNHSLISLQGYGPEIVSGPDAAAVGFGSGHKPAGMTSAPVGGMAAPPVLGAPTGAPAPVPGLPPPPAPPAAPAAPSVAQVPVQPHTAILTPPGAPPPPPSAPMPPAPPAEPALTVKAAGATYGQMLAAGWTDATLRQHGYLA